MEGRFRGIENMRAMPSTGTTRIFVRLDVFYPHNPVMLDRRGKLATNVLPALFDSYLIGHDSVTFQHHARSSVIGIATSYLFNFDAKKADIPWDFFFGKLGDAGVGAITGYRLVSNYIVPSEQPFDQMVNRFATGMNPLILNPEMFGNLVDVGQIYTLKHPGGYDLNLNVGPMLREQWQGLLGANVAAIESELPEKSWNIGVFHPKPMSCHLGLGEAQREISKQLGEWDKTIQRSALTDFAPMQAGKDG